MALDGCGPVGQSRVLANLKPSPVTTKLPPDRFVEDHGGRGVDHGEQRLGRGPGDGARGVEHPTAYRYCGGPEKRGSEGARPPARLRRGRTECGPKEYAG